MKVFKLETLGNDSDKSLAFINQAPEDLGVDDWMLSEGERIGSLYPKKAKITLLKRKPGRKLCSFIGNTQSLLIVADAVREVIVATSKGEMEVLKFTLFDQKGRPLSDDYWIINPIGTVDCVNKKKSEIEYLDEPGDPYHGEVVGVDRYVLDSRKLKAAPSLFRVPEEPDEYFFKEDLHDKLVKNEFTNFVFEEIEVA